ncbi:kinase-like domain, phloem protein 2-like protein [Tanacetum coccineum]|uniref:Kinase-like domain, phloem protein 2-like protein n=1 Tax=Tanacetum coccineum TaxID=301880 RepID=A0ABQ5C5R4_9ASTR
MSSVNPDDFAHLKIPLQDILYATNNFDEENLLGEADFGNHYGGRLWRFRKLIEIQAQRWSNKEKDDDIEQQFWMEIFMLSSLKHKNLVSFVGDSMMLTWVRRLEICVGIAQALSYIHYDEPRAFSVIHRNINSETILLTDNFEPKLSEFRLSMKIEASQRHHSFHVEKFGIGGDQ